MSSEPYNYHVPQFSVRSSANVTEAREMYAICTSKVDEIRRRNAAHITEDDQRSIERWEHCAAYYAKRIMGLGA